MNSPTTTPMIASVTATFMPLKTNGGELGKRTRTSTCQVDMRSDRHSRNMLASTDCRPATVAIRIGKKQMKIEKVMRDDGPIPSQTMNSGASAIFGISWKKMMLG